jgi:5'-nucleotidase
MRILVSNDDGIYSPGIAALAEVASEFGTVRVVAPDVERSSMGHAITASRPLSYRPTTLANAITAYRVNGTPADCVAVGAYHWERVDLVLSGLNLGNAIWHSGTLAAAKQAALLGLRGIVLSAPAGIQPISSPSSRAALDQYTTACTTVLPNSRRLTCAGAATRARIRASTTRNTRN